MSQYRYDEQHVNLYLLIHPHLIQVERHEEDVAQAQHEVLEGNVTLENSMD